MMQRRDALCDDQWELIKDLLPGRPDHAGVTAKDSRLLAKAFLYRYLPGLEGEALLADKAFDADERVLTVLDGAGIVAVIPPKRNRVVQREDDQALYQARHLIENLFEKPKQFRAIVTRYDKLPRNILAGIHLASACILLK